MDPSEDMVIDGDPSLDLIRSMPLPNLELTLEILGVPPEFRLSPTFLDDLSELQLSDALKMCLGCWTMSNHRVFPRQFQIEASLATLAGTDTLIDAGTGSGKTLCIILPLLVDSEHISIVVTPLRRLQSAQTDEFMAWGLRTVSVNDDTPKDAGYYQTIANGHYNLILIQPEQTGRHKGHYTRFGRLLDKDSFVNKIRRLHIDEAHYISTVGTPTNGQAAFRPAFGNLDKFRLRLKKVAVQALSGTFPPHIKKTVIKKLLMDEDSLIHIKISSNRPSITLATHPIVGNISDYRNLAFLLPQTINVIQDIPRAIVFFDNRKQGKAALEYLLSLLPATFRKLPVPPLRSYDSIMSKEYLDQTFTAWKDPQGPVRVLFGTEAVSTGLHAPGITIGVQYGLPSDLPSFIQRMGRIGRDTRMPALFLLLYEEWAAKVDNSKLLLDPLDGDKPYNIPAPENSKGKTNPKSTAKRNRIAITVFKLVLETQGHGAGCIRNFLANYLGDDPVQALECTAPWCCTSCTDPPVVFDHFLPGKLLYKDDDGQLFYGHHNDPNRQLCTTRRKEATAPQKRTTATVPLRASLRRWRRDLHIPSPLHVVWPRFCILSDTDIKTLALIHPDLLRSPTILAEMLRKSVDWSNTWATSLYDTIHEFDRSLAQQPRKALRKRKRGRGKEASDYSDGGDDEGAESDSALDRALANIRNRTRTRGTRQRVE